jgi:hypothetical protein
MLGNGTMLQFALDHVPDPPAVSFANDLPRLNGMWDYKLPHWSGTSSLVVNGHPVPVVHWPELYKYGRKDQWKGMKARWFEWKVTFLYFLSVSFLVPTLLFQVVVERYREGTPEEFWRTFSNDNGTRMTFTTITNRL